MGTLAEERYSVCLNHPEKQEIFKLETLLIEAGYPYYFNFWEDLRPVFGGSEDGDPESIDWNTYEFRIEVANNPQINKGDKIVVVGFSKDEKNLLAVWKAKHIGDDVLEPEGFWVNASAEEAMEIINGCF